MLRLKQSFRLSRAPLASISSAHLITFTHPARQHFVISLSRCLAPTGRPPPRQLTLAGHAAWSLGRTCGWRWDWPGLRWRRDLDVEDQRLVWSGAEAQRETAPTSRSLQPAPYPWPRLAHRQLSAAVVARCKVGQVVVVLLRDAGALRERVLFRHSNLGGVQFTHAGHRRLLGAPYKKSFFVR
jgi:hypothetical protein